MSDGGTNGRLDGITVAILATDGFEQVELTSPKEALEEAGARTHVVAPKPKNGDSIRGWDHDRWGESVPVDRTLEEASVEEYDALVLPGGVLNPDQLRQNPRAVRFAKAFFDAGKPVAAICHGPQTLIEAGVLGGRTMTSYRAIRTDLENAGAEWVDREVVTDGNLTTSREPKDLESFNRRMVETIEEGAKSRRAAV